MLIFGIRARDEVARFKHGDWVTSVRFSPDGTRVVTASSDTRIWDTSRLLAGDDFAMACAQLGNDTELSEVRAYYRLGDIAPICGQHTPLSIDWREVQ